MLIEFPPRCYLISKIDIEFLLDVAGHYKNKYPEINSPLNERTKKIYIYHILKNCSNGVQRGIEKIIMGVTRNEDKTGLKYIGDRTEMELSRTLILQEG